MPGALSRIDGSAGLRVPTGALNGRVAESDANGNITWRPARDARRPGHNNLVTWTVDPLAGAGDVSHPAGVLFVYRAYIPEAQTSPVSTFHFPTAAAASGTTAIANFFLGVYSKTGTLLGSTANQATAASAAAGLKTAALTAATGQSLTLVGGPDEYVWLGFVIGTQATTPLRLFRAAANSTYLHSMGLSAAPWMAGSTQTGLTALPATFDPTTLAQASYLVLGVS